MDPIPPPVPAGGDFSNPDLFNQEAPDCAERVFPPGKTLFVILMLLETINFASDCFQVYQVYNSLQKWNAPPFGLDRTRMSVFWTVATNVTSHTKLLALPRAQDWGNLPYQYDPYKKNYFRDGNQLSGVCPFIGGAMTTSGNSKIYQYDPTMNYWTFEPVCASLEDIFDIPIPLPRVDNNGNSSYTGLICPSIHYLFDSHSRQDPTSSDPEGTRVDMTLHYKSDWQQALYPIDSCRDIRKFWESTITVFALECALTVLQLAISAIVLLRTTGTTHLERIKHTVEFPLIGFALALARLSKEDWLMYTWINEQKKRFEQVTARVTGAHRRDHILRFKVKLRWPFYIEEDGCCCGCCANGCCDCERSKAADAAGLPKSAPLGYALLYPMLLPLTEKYWSAFIDCSTCCSAICSIFLAPMGLFVAALSGIFTFFALLLWTPSLFLMWVTFGDRLYVSRLLHDLPMAIIALKYMSVMGYPNATSIWCAFNSFVLIIYYLIKLFSALCREYNNYSIGSLVGQSWPVLQTFGPVRLSPCAAACTALSPLFTVFNVWIWGPRTLLCEFRSKDSLPDDMRSSISPRDIFPNVGGMMNAFPYSSSPATTPNPIASRGQGKTLYLPPNAPVTVAVTAQPMYHPSAVVFLQWFYLDQNFHAVGPFSNQDMVSMNASMQLHAWLLVRAAQWTQYYPLLSVYPDHASAFSYVPYEPVMTGPPLR